MSAHNHKEMFTDHRMGAVHGIRSRLSQVSTNEAIDGCP